MKKKVYHVNPHCQKWEEENHLKNMEKKIRAAKSALPAAARGVSATRAGTPSHNPYTRSNSARSTSTRTPTSTGPSGAPPAALVNVDPAQLDALIATRLQDILGLPLMKRVQDYVNRRQGDNGAAGGAGVKPPKPKGRPRWNEDWNNPVQPTNSKGASGLPLPDPVLKPAVVAARGNPRAASPGIKRASGDGRQDAAGRVQLLPSNPSTPTGNASRPVSSTRYNRTPPPAITRSDMAAMAVLNPSAPVATLVAPQNPQETAYGAAKPLVLSVAATASTAVDSAMMSLSRMSMASPGAAARRPPFSAGRLSTAPGRVSAAAMQHTPASGQISESIQGSVKPVLTDAVQEGGNHSGEEDEYELQFEEYEGSDNECGEAVDAAKEEMPKTDFEDLRQSVAVLNELVQMKIQGLKASQAAPALRNSSQQPKMLNSVEQDDDVEITLRLEAPQDGGKCQPDPLLGTMKLMGCDDQLGASNDLLGGLHQSDLEYLEMLGRQEDEQHGQVAKWSDSKDDCWYDAPNLETGPPASMGKQWGDRAPFTNNADPTSGTATSSAIARLKQMQQQRAKAASQADVVAVVKQSTDSSQAAQPSKTREASHAIVPAEDEGDDMVLLGTCGDGPGGQTAQLIGALGAVMTGTSAASLTEVQAGQLAHQTEALYDSLRQLHQLMNGPRGAELSPKDKFKAGAGGFTPPQHSLACSPLRTTETNIDALSPTTSSHDPPNDQSGRAVGRGLTSAFEAAAGVTFSVAASGPRSSGSGSRASSHQQGCSQAAHDRAQESVSTFEHSPGQVQEDAERQQGVLSGAASGLEVEPPAPAAEPSSQLGRLTPKNQLCPDDVEWMSGLMQTLSQSLQGEDLLGLVPGLSSHGTLDASKRHGSGKA